MIKYINKVIDSIKAVVPYSIGFLLRWLLPINENKFFFMSMFGNSYGDSVKNISDYVKAHHPGAVVIWAFSDYYYNSVDDECMKVRLYSIEYYYHIVTSKFIVSNFSCKKMMLLKREEQVKLQTWHGTALKRIGEDAKISDHSNLLLLFRPDTLRTEAARTDIFISGSRFMTEVYHRALKYDKNIFETGMPRNDIFFQSRPDVKKRVHKQYGIDENKKIILYAPTFRPDGKFTYYDVDLNAIKTYFQEKTSEEYVIFVRLHSGLLRKSKEIANFFPKGTVNATLYPDMQELLYSTDVLVTDYSSSMFDFMYTYKPIVMYIPDKELYNRGFYFDIEHLPFIKINNNKEILSMLDSFNESKYRKDIDDFLREIGSVDNAHSTETVYNLMIECGK